MFKTFLLGGLGVLWVMLWFLQSHWCYIETYSSFLAHLFLDAWQTWVYSDDHIFMSKKAHSSFVSGIYNPPYYIGVYSPRQSRNPGHLTSAMWSMAVLFEGWKEGGRGEKGKHHEL